MAETLLTVEHLIKKYRDQVILDDVSLDVKKGEVIVVVGPSGCGKSTLLRCINALEPIQGGVVKLGSEVIDPKSKSLTRLRQKIGMVFQSYDLFPHVALGVVSPDSNVIKSLDNWNSKDQMIVISGTTAETYLTENYPDIPLQKYDSYATAKNALENGNGVAWANDNTEVIAFALQNKGYTVGISELGNKDTIAPAVSKGNDTLLDWVNEEIKSLGDEQFFHKDYEETLVDTYGKDYEEDLVVEGGAVK